MIDIHAHILPGVDDGADNMDMALQMLIQAAESGVRGITATPHCNLPGEQGNYASPELEALWDRLDSEIRRQRIAIALYRGMEVFATPELPELLARDRIWTLNDTDYLLLEFSFDEDPAFCDMILSSCLDMGYQPIVAHPERYYFIQEDPSLAFNWCVNGYGLQLNKGSFLGRFGPDVKRTAELLTDHGLAACVASDAHSPFRRTADMEEVRRYLTAVFGEEYMRLLLEINPEHILRGEELLGYEPIPFQ